MGLLRMEWTVHSYMAFSTVCMHQSQVSTAVSQCQLSLNGRRLGIGIRSRAVL